MDQVAWALTRDTALLTGRPVTAGSSLGELQLWFADNPVTPDAAPPVSAYLADLIIVLCTDRRLPVLQYAPAARFRTRSPRESVLRQVHSTASGALVSGVILAAVTAVLRIWLK